jgi:hypothetical protein
MTTKIISTYITAGYSLAAKYSALDITTTGGIGGTGLTLAAAATVDNDGFILDNGSGNGVTADAALTLVNGSADDQTSQIHGYSGIFAPNAAATISNFGTIQGRGTFGDGVFIVAGGTVTNGASDDSAAEIYGVSSGVAASVAAKVTNFGTLRGESVDGVYLKAGGSVTNGSATTPRAFIIGGGGVVSAGGALTVVNFRTIEGYGTTGDGVDTVGGGTITNGAASDTTARIFGVYAGVASAALARVINSGTIVGSTEDGVYLRAGGSVTNGAVADPRATIEGATGGVHAATGVTTVSNLGTIESTVSGSGVYVASGVVTNGSAVDQGALIQGVDFAVVAMTASATVTNFGVIDATGNPDADTPGAAVSLKAGGVITNGAATDTTAWLQGEGFGVLTSGFTKITNFGTISAAANGIYISGGGSVTNGSAADTTAAIVAQSAMIIRDGVGTVANFGTIITLGNPEETTGNREGVGLFGDGAVTNGSAQDTSALIDGLAAGVVIAGPAGTVSNFGTIEADGSSGSTGVYLGGGTLTNGSAADTTAVIVGSTGVEIGAGGGATVTNFGTLHGFGGDALYFLYAGSVLNVEAGCAFEGAVLGGGGVLNLASGAGTISGLTSAGNVTVSGSMAKTTFQHFGQVEIGAGASFTDTGVVGVAAGHVVNDYGTLSLGGSGADSIVNSGEIDVGVTGVLTLAGAVKNGGTILVAGGTVTVNGAVTGVGAVTINGGKADFASTFAENVAFSAAGGVLDLSHSQTYTGKITGFAKTSITSLDLVDIAFGGGTKASYSGTAAGGVLTVTDGAHTAQIKLTGDYIGSTFTVASDGHGGTTVTDPPAARPSIPVLPLVAAMAGFGGGAGETHGHAPSPVRHGDAVLVRPA